MHRFRHTESGALKRLPGSLSLTAARRRALAVMSGTDITARQTIWMSRHVVPRTTSLSAQPIAAQAAPRNCPGLSAPKRKRCSQKTDAILTGSGCTGLSLHRSRVAAACRLRRSCHRHRGPVCPSTFRLSRSPQPASRRIVVWPLLAPAYALRFKQLKGVR